MLEAGLGLKRTKGGVGDKEQAYLVQRTNVTKCGFLLIAVAVLCLVIGLGMETDLAHTTKQVAVAQQRVVAHKKALLVTKELDMMDNAQQEAKLIKVLSLIQAHFARDRKEAEMMVVFHKRFNDAMLAHKKAIDVVLAELDGNPKVVAYLREQLYGSAKDFHIRTASVAKRYGAAITTEGQEAEERLRTLTQSILAELAADVREEHAEKAQEATLEAKDPEWKKMAAAYAKAHPAGGAGGSKSQDQRDVTSMITHFEQHVKDLPENTLSGGEIAAAQRNLARFRTDPRVTFGEMSAEVDRFFGAAQVPVPDVGEQAQLLVKYEELIEQELFLTKDLEKLQAELANWEDGKLSNAEMVASIETEVANGQVDPTWLHDAAKEPEEKMLHMDQKDHEFHDEASIPELSSKTAAAAGGGGGGVEHKGV